MYNNELYNKLEKEFGEDKMPQFALMASYMFDMMLEDGQSCDAVAYDYESQWWYNKFEELVY
jgi:hypothetical protein